MLVFFSVFVVGAKLNTADHHFPLPLANFHHEFFGEEEAEAVVVVTAQLHSDNGTRVVAFGDDGTAALS